MRRTLGKRVGRGAIRLGELKKLADVRLMFLDVAQVLRALSRSVTWQGSELDLEETPDRSGHLRTPADTDSQEWAFVDLALSQNTNLLAPPLAPPGCSNLSNHASGLEPPYGIEP